jgi:outer membrane protein TolC
MVAAKRKILSSVVLLVVLAAGAITGLEVPALAEPTSTPPSDAAPQEKPSAARPFTLAEQPPRYLTLEEAVALALKKLGRERSPGVLTLRPEGTPARSQTRRDTEVAYWVLYGAYWDLHIQEQGLELAYGTWKKARQRHVAGSGGRTDPQMAHGEYEHFRNQRLTALEAVQVAEEKLRALLEIDDGVGPLVPTDAPRLTRYEPDWSTSLTVAVAKREELHEARQRLAKIKVLVALEQVTYRAIRLMPFPAIQPLPALYERSQLVASPFVCGFLRDPEPKLVPASRLCLSLVYLVLKDTELKVGRELGLQYRRLASTYQRLDANRTEAARLREQLRAHTAGYSAQQDTIDRVLEAQRFWLDARAQHVAAAVAYANTRCWFSWARGTLFEDSDRIARTPEDAPPESELPVLWRRVRPFKDVWPLPEDDAREPANPPLVPCDVELLFGSS